MSCCKHPDESDGGLICKYVIHAPHDVVYESFIDHIWYKNNPLYIAPQLMETPLSQELDIEYPQRSIGCKAVLETIYSVRKNEWIEYKVESWVMPTSKYHARIEFKDCYDPKKKVQYCLMTWTAHFNFKWSSCIYCCPLGAVAFRKTLETLYNLMGASLKSHVETKKQK